MLNVLHRPDCFFQPPSRFLPRLKPGLWDSVLRNGKPSGITGSWNCSGIGLQHQNQFALYYNKLLVVYWQSLSYFHAIVRCRKSQRSKDATVLTLCCCGGNEWSLAKFQLICSYWQTQGSGSVYCPIPAKQKYVQMQPQSLSVLVLRSSGNRL